MEQEKKKSQGKGGRPRQQVKRNRPLTVKCTGVEKTVIAHRAKKGKLTTSEYLRGLGMSGKVVIHVNTLPGEVLALTGALHHVGGLLNQIAKKRNSGEDLNALERADLTVLKARVYDAIHLIQTHVTWLEKLPPDGPSADASATA